MDIDLKLDFFLMEGVRVSGPWGSLGPDHFWKYFWGPSSPLDTHQENFLFFIKRGPESGPLVSHWILDLAEWIEKNSHNFCFHIQ